ncbi:ABC transporter permease, partial [Gemmatimonadota bacterium]
MSGSPEWKKRTHINGKRPDVKGLPVEEDVDREMRSHIDLMVDDLIADGWDPDEAREQALRTFGDLEKARRKQKAITRTGDRNIRLARFLDARREDIRYGIRTLRKARGFTLATLLLLALGIGANTAVFSVVYNVVLKPLPYREPDHLALVFEVLPEGSLFGFSPPNFESIRERTRTFEDIAAYYPASFTLTGAGDPELLPAMRVSAGFFELLGITMAEGRSFLEEEDTPGGNPVAILSHQLWMRLFNGRTDAVGGSIILGGSAHTIVGVTPADFHFVDGESDIWVPCAWTGEDKANRGRHWLQVLGRLSPGSGIDQASDELDNLAAQLSIEYPATNDGWGMRTRGLHRTVVSGVDTYLLILTGVVGLLLLIACANVGNLILVRAEKRGKEMAIRSAIGADRGRLMAQLFTE